jgi:uncharacterized glyoxalase superfamily protein PhnB
MTTARFTGITPYLHYEDAGGMADWLTRVFGFEERARYVDHEGTARQVEMLVGGTELWMSGHGPGYWTERGGGPDQLILVWVDDVDAHHTRVRAAGIGADDPEDKTYDVRTYTVTDPEGYRWDFLARIGTGYQKTSDGGLTEVLPADRA